MNQENHYVLTSGRRIDANRGILGIGHDGVYEGYDGDVETSIDLWPGSLHVPLTPEERRELAEIAIRMWNEYADNGPSKLKDERDPSP